LKKKKKLWLLKKIFLQVATSVSTALAYQPLIKLKSTTVSETRVEVKAKTSGEVVKIGSRQGDFIQKDSVLCSLGIVELNRTEVKAPFSGLYRKDC
jgi:multidrug efflux system membrane fusion protein